VFAPASQAPWSRSRVSHMVAVSSNALSLHGPRSQYFVYDVPAEFTSALLDAEVDVRNTPMDVLERSALGPEIAFHKFLLDDVSGAPGSPSSV
jgi:hypothetical protein